MINKVFGTGGIGTGIFFELEGGQTLGRNESRLGRLTDYRDYCKGHIILHYVAALTKGTDVYAIGKTGCDEQGRMLINEMKGIGIDTRYVEATHHARTMFSVCFQYPDGAGGNITASNSACDLVDAAYIQECSGMIDQNSLVLAAPEVPLASRIRLLEIGRERGAFTVSSFLSGEAAAFGQMGGLELTDLLSVNMEEANAISGGNMEEAAKKITCRNPAIKLIITAGGDGSFVYQNKAFIHIPCIPAEVVSTAGAGDAFLGGVIAGLISGKSLVQAAEYGAVIARFAVLSPDTIAKDITIDNVKKFMG